MSDKYILLVYYIHSYFETVRGELEITKETTVENFDKSAINKSHCDKIFKYSLTQWNYELSHNQVCNGIDLLLKSFNTSNK